MVRARPRALVASVLIPLYAIFEIVPSTRATARRLGLVTITQMVQALVYAVEHPPATGTIRVVEVPEIKRAAKSAEVAGPGA